ncbi:MAG: DUF4399 domain-containing protein [Gammaproteobacteria bacterium]|nr:DUF4399 domain-containing protein [Gammaproteobacteria bacterium]MBU1722567.1 DUF4399 domain-containing protein [Gammaproteobacteria bacterium]MBU2004468.1 DUF4399 domain-containing protein [Gammaproteobacteria bacterium]
MKYEKLLATAGILLLSGWVSMAPADDAAKPAAAGAAMNAAEMATLASPPAPEGAKVYIISPEDGAEVSSPVKVVFGLSGMGVAPAGVDKEKTGHHHLIIDGGDELPLKGMPMGSDIKHFGGGQTEAEIELEPGKHTLQLSLGDKNHVPFDPPLVSGKITITVK